MCNSPLDLLGEKYLVTGYKSLWAKYGLDFQCSLGECHAMPKILLMGIPCRRNSQPEILKPLTILKMVKCFSTEFEHNKTSGKIQIKLFPNMSFSMRFV